MNEPVATQKPPSVEPKKAAVDESPRERPGVPQELDPPRPLANAHWIRPDQQRSEEAPLIGVGRQLTPVYSIENPPRLLSGALRKLAYRVPDYQPRRWLLLMLADRIDVLESNPARLLRALGGVGLLGLGVYGLSKLRRA
jgi:hypothetical protein